MGFFKPKGKHAQGAHAPSASKQAEAAQDQKPEDVEGAEEAAEAAAASDTTTSEDVAETAATAVAEPMPQGAVAAGDEAPDAPAFDAFAPVTSDGVVLKPKRRVGKIVGITFGIIIGILLVAYIAGAIVFMNWFFPRTSIVGNDVSMMPNDEVVALLDKAADDYTLDIVGNGFTYHTTAEKIDLAIDSDAIVKQMHAELNSWAWPVLLFQDSHDVSDAMSVSFDQQKYDSEIVHAITLYNKDAVAPVDATIAYDENKKKFKVVDEVPGTQYDSHVILAAMSDAISSLNPNIKLTSDYLIQPNVFGNDERLVNSAELATGLVSAHITLTMADQKAAEIDGSNLSNFIRMDDNLGVTLDEEALDQWVTDLSNGFDTVGTERTYTRPDGKEITVSGGAYGWSTDAPALKDEVVAAIKSGETKTIDIPCEQTAFAYNGPGKPDWNNRYIDVDLSEQYVRMYGDDGSVIWESACISGSPDGEHNTWPGVWYITDKQSPSKLIGYLPSGKKEYETTVSFWMPFEGNGIGLHDATWQPSFGGSMYASGYGSHGCVNLPYGAAEELYGICDIGDVVIAHY